jgi:TatD DNase family protein
MATRIVELGFYVSISGPVTYSNERRLPEIVRAAPMERLLLETDAPYLAPYPHRGQRNEPAHIPLMAAALAQLSGTTVDAIAAGTTVTAGRCFTKMAPSLVR